MQPELRCPEGHINGPPAVFCTTCGLPLPRPMELDATPAGFGAGSGQIMVGPPHSAGPSTVPTVVQAPPPVFRPVGTDPSPPSRKVWPVIVIAVLALLVVGLGTAFIMASGSSTPTSTRTTTTPTQSAAPTVTQAPPVTANPEQQQAAELNNLLSNSTVDRSQVVAAAADIANCGNLQADENTMTQAQTSRQNLVNQLGALSLGSLPQGLVADLSSAWTASASADGYYAAWAADESSSFNGCTNNNTSDSNYQSAGSSDVQASTAKGAFVNAWNPVAQQFGLTTYQPSQL